jgi:hypothetical protein
MMMVQLSSPHTTYSTQRNPDANPSSLTEDRQPGFHLPSPDSTPPKQIGIGRGNIDRHLSMTPQPPCTHANIHMTAPPCPGQSRGHRERRNPCQLDVNAASHETRASRVQPRTANGIDTHIDTMARCTSLTHPPRLQDIGWITQTDGGMDKRSREAVLRMSTQQLNWTELCGGKTC